MGGLAFPHACGVSDSSIRRGFRFNDQASIQVSDPGGFRFRFRKFRFKFRRFLIHRPGAPGQSGSAATVEQAKKTTKKYLMDCNPKVKAMIRP